MDQASTLLRQVCPSSRVRWSLESWAHHLALHFAAALYVGGAFEEGVLVLAVYISPLALLHTWLFGGPAKACGLGHRLRLVHCVCVVAPLTAEILLWLVCLPLNGNDCQQGMHTLQLGLAGILGYVHSYALRHCPRPHLAAAGGRTWRLCLLLAACAASEYSVFGATYCLAFIVIAGALALPFPSLQRSLGTQLFQDYCWRAITVVARLHVLLVGLGYFLHAGEEAYDDDESEWGTLHRIVLGTRGFWLNCQCLFALVLLGELQCDSSETREDEGEQDRPSVTEEVELQDHPQGRMSAQAEPLQAEMQDMAQEGTGGVEEEAEEEREDEATQAEERRGAVWAMEECWIRMSELATQCLDLPNRLPVQAVEALGLCLWVVAWPASPSLPLLLLGLSLFWSPGRALSSGLRRLVFLYVATLCAARYACAVLLSADLVEEQDRREGRWLRLLGLKYATDGQSLAVLLLATLVLAYCAGRDTSRTGEDSQPGERDEHDVALDATWQWRAVRAFFFLRIVAVVTVLYLGIYRQGDEGTMSALIKLGYICWFVAHLGTKPSATLGWDVLSGHRGLWHCLLAYSGAVTVFLLVQRALMVFMRELNFVGVATMGRQTKFLYHTPLLPYLALAGLAAVQKTALKETWVSDDSFFRMSSGSARRLLRFGLFAQISVLLLAVLLPPASIDSLILLLVLLSIMMVAQVDMQSRLLLPLLTLIANVARGLLLLRSLTLLPAVQRELQQDRWASIASSLAIYTKPVSPWTQISLAALLLLARTLGSTVQVAPALLEEELHLIRPGSHYAEYLEKAVRLYPWGLLICTFLGTAAFPVNFVSSITMLCVLCLLFMGRGWHLAGLVISATLSVSLLWQYLTLLEPEGEREKQWLPWPRWDGNQFCVQLALMCACVFQPALQRGARAAAAAMTAADPEGESRSRPSVGVAQSWEFEPKRVVAYDAQLGAVAMLLLALWRSSFWSLVFALVAGIFICSGDAPKELSFPRARFWLHAMASVVLAGLLWQNILCVWRGIDKDHLLPNFFSSGCTEYNAVFLYLEDGTPCHQTDANRHCFTQRRRCEEDWYHFFCLSGGWGPAEFAVYLGLCFLCWGGNALTVRNHSVLSSGQETTGTEAPDGDPTSLGPRPHSEDHVVTAASNGQDEEEDGKQQEEVGAERQTYTYQGTTVLVYVAVISTWLCMCFAFLMQAESNAIAMGYLLIVVLELSAIYDLNINRDPITGHLRMIRGIQTFNIVVVIVSLLFQSPKVPCPSTMLFRPGTPSAYLSTEQCVNVKARGIMAQAEPLGMVFGCLGLMKTSSPLLDGAFGRWNLLICCSCLVESICILRWKAEVTQHINRQREKLEFHARWYMEQHKLSRQFQLLIWDTKREILLAKLSRLTEHLDAMREIWDGQRQAFSEDEEKDYLWATRVENLCLRSGVQRAHVEALLREFDEAANPSGSTTADAAKVRLMHIAVDRLLLEYLHQLLLRHRRKIKREEEEAAKAKLLEECRELDPDHDHKQRTRRRRPSAIYDDISRMTEDSQSKNSLAGGISTPRTGRNSTPRAGEAQLKSCMSGGLTTFGDLPDSGDLATSSSFSPLSGGARASDRKRKVTICEVDPEVELVDALSFATRGTDESPQSSALASEESGLLVGLVRRLCYDLIDDFLFISRFDQTQFEHRRRSSLLQLLGKVVYSQVTVLLVCAAGLQFLEYRSVPAAVTVAGVSLALSVYPQVPWRCWTLLYQWNSAMVCAKMLFQLQIFCQDGTLHLDKTCSPTTGVPWTAVFGLVHANGTMGGLLWADLLVCAAILLNMFAALQSGRCRHLQSDTGIERRVTEQAEEEGPPSGESQLALGYGILVLARRIHYKVWRLVVLFVDPGTDASYERFLGSATLRRPSKDLYAFRFTCILILLVLLIFNWQEMSGEGRTFDKALSSNHFSGTQVLVLILFMLLIVCDRVLYTWYRSDLYSDGRGRSPAPSSDDTFLGSWVASRDSGQSEPSTPDGAADMEAPSKVAEGCQLKVFVRMLHQGLLVTHILIIHTVLMQRWWSSTVQGVMPPLLRMRTWKLVLFYGLYLLYIVLTSFQLRYDVHIVRGGMRFTKSTDLLTKTCFRAYSALPFLHELRVLTDWTATVTALDFFMWMKLEDAQHNLYRVRTDMEVRSFIPPGQKRPSFEKVYLGGLLLFALLGLLVGPILYFSSLNSLARKPNPVISGELTVVLELASKDDGSNPWVRSLPLYRAQSQMVDVIPGALPGETRQTVLFPQSSDHFWMISPRAREGVVEMLKTGVNTKIVLSYVFDRQATAVKAMGRDVSELLNASEINLFAETLDVAKTRGTHAVINIKNTFLPSKRLSSGAKVVNEGLLEHSELPKNVRLEVVNMGNGSLPYWLLATDCKDEGGQDPAVIQPGSEGDGTCQQLSCTLMSDDIASEGSSVHSLYVGVVLTIGNFLRLAFKDSSKRVIYEELPDTDLLLDLCDGIYIARIQGDLQTEYKLYYELIRVYRSPELLARVSLPKGLRHERAPSTVCSEPGEQQRPRLRKKGTNPNL